MPRFLSTFIFRVHRAGTSDRRVRKGSSRSGAWRIISSGVVFRHEQTLSGPKADRLELLRRTRTHTGQLFMLYSDRGGSRGCTSRCRARRTPEVEVRDEYEVAHRLWPVTNAR